MMRERERDVGKRGRADREKYKKRTPIFSLTKKARSGTVPNTMNEMKVTRPFDAAES